MNSTLDKGKNIFWYFALFFGLVATVNALMVTLAVKTDTGMITDHPYERGIAYNQVVKAGQEQEKLGWKAEIDLQKDTLYVTLRDIKGALLKPERITAHFTRPTQAGMDFDVTLSNGKARLDVPAPGIWEVRIYATVGNILYQQSKRVVIE